jgi:hypothetical protein
MLFSCLAYFSILKMETTNSPKRAVGFQRPKWRCIPEDRTLRNHRCENLKLYRLPHSDSAGFQRHFPCLLFACLLLPLPFFVFCLFLSFSIFPDIFFPLYIPFQLPFFPLPSYSRTSWFRANALECNWDMFGSNPSRGGMSYSRVSCAFPQFL